MGIFLAILKWIGIVLLVVLAVIVLLICLILFVPVRYSARITTDGGLCVKARVTWLLRLVKFKADYADSELKSELKVAWFTVLGKNKEEQAQEELQPEIPPYESFLDDEPSGTENPDIGPAEGVDIEADFEAFESEAEEPAEKEEALEMYEAAKKQPTQTSARDIRKRAQKAVKQEKKRKRKGIEDDDIFAENDGRPTLIEKIRRIIAQVMEKADLAKEVKAAYDEVKAYIFKIVKHILPRKIKGFVRFGFEDPSLTGKICAVIGILYPVIPEKLDIDPDFTQSVFEADVTISGRIILFIVLLNGLKILMNRRVRALIRKFRGKDKKTGKGRRREPAYS